MEIPGKELLTCENLSGSKNATLSLDSACKKDSASAFEGRQLTSSGAKETDRTIMIEDVLERSFSAKSKQAVECILAQVEQMSPTEKLLLYLKLPTGKSNVDPLRQHMNPLGSRSEIYQTITWIKTHLQEDPDVSLPKQDVYDQYLDYCSANAVKPLSTADFGKVMKQVYPDVRPRRLGTRGNSRYCYAGMRKRLRLEPPNLPDLSTNSKVYLEDSGKNNSSEQLLLTTVSCLIREWAEKVTGLKFNSLQQLACHLIDTLAVDSRSVAALTLLSTLSLSRRGVPSRPASSNAALSADGSALAPVASTHLSGMCTNLLTARPASETPRSTADRDHKRKLQEDTDPGRARQGFRGKRSKHRPSSSPSDGETVLQVRGGPGKRSQVKSQVNEPALDVNQSFANQPRELVTTNGIPKDVTIFNENLAVSSSNQYVKTEEVESVKAEKSADSSGKVAIPRLPKSSKPGVPNLIILPPPVQQVKQKYKPIKPKPESEEEDSSKRTRRSLDGTLSMTNGCGKLKNNESFIGCLEKDALDDYLYEGSNSQEPEEEMMQYFPQGCQMPSASAPSQVEGSVDKISQLRQLLERNLNQNVSGRGFQAPNKHTPYQNGLSAAASLSLLSQRSQQKAALPSLPSHSQMTSRRVSFEVPVEPDSASSSVPPSPKQGGVFSFTPISPRPYSPVNGRCPSKASSANASPFVSPRNTPVPRAKAVGPPQVSSYIASPLQVAPLQIAQSRTFTRSASASCDASPFNIFDQHLRPTDPNMAPNMANPMTLDVKPDLSDLSIRATADLNGSRSQTCALSPLQLPRVQFPVSMSAPQSPVVPTSRSSRKAKFSFRKEARAQSLEIPVPMSSQQFNTNPSIAQLRFPEQQMNRNGPHSEVGFFFPEDESGMAPMPGMPSSSSFRSQSVPLRRMVSSAQTPFSYYNQGQPMLNMYTPSNGSSVTPTPVPSEMADFGVDSDTMLPSAQTATDFTNEGTDLLLSEGNSAPFNSLLKEMMCLLDKGEKDSNEVTCSQQREAHPGQSHSYPNTPLPYKHVQDSSLRGDPLFNSFQLQTGRSTDVASSFPNQGYDVLFSAGNTADDDDRLAAAAAAAVHGSVSVLDDLDDMSGRELQVDGSHPPDLSGQGNMALLLEESTGPYMTPVFEYNELAPALPNCWKCSFTFNGEHEKLRSATYCSNTHQNSVKYPSEIPNNILAKSSE